MEEQALSKEQQEALEEALSRGQAFEELIRTKGWEYVKHWYQQKIQRFGTSLLLEDGKVITDFEDERRELIGLRKLFGVIDNDIKVLRDTNEKNTKSAKK